MEKQERVRAKQMGVLGRKPQPEQRQARAKQGSRVQRGAAGAFGKEGAGGGYISNEGHRRTLS